MSAYKGGTRFLPNSVSAILKGFHKLRIRFLMFHTVKEAGKVCQQISNQIDQMPTYLKKRQNNTLNKKCVSCYQRLMGCRICERTNKAVEATRLSQKNIIPHIRDFSLYPLQQIQSSKCINGPGIGKSCILRTDSNKL